MTEEMIGYVAQAINGFFQKPDSGVAAPAQLAGGHV